MLCRWYCVHSVLSPFPLGPVLPHSWPPSVSHLPQAVFPFFTPRHSSLGTNVIPPSLLSSSTKDALVTPARHLLQRSRLASSFLTQRRKQRHHPLKLSLPAFQAVFAPGAEYIAQVPRGLRAGLCLHMPGGMHRQHPMKNKQLSCKDKEAARLGEAVEDVSLRS